MEFSFGKRQIGIKPEGRGKVKTGTDGGSGLEAQGIGLVGRKQVQKEGHPSLR
jgi:hypothetical protein